MNGTDDGLAVVLPANSTSQNLGAFSAGIVVKDILPGKLGEVQVYGFSKAAKIPRATRANSTSAWPTMASIPMGATLGADSAFNAISPAGVAFMKGGVAEAAELVAAGPTLPSSAGSGTVFYQAVKTFLRFM